MILQMTFIMLTGKVNNSETTLFENKVVHMIAVGQMALVSIFSHVIFIYLTWRVMISINFDPLIRKGNATEAKILLFFIAIFIGSGVSRFFLEILQWSQDLIYLF